MCELKNFRTTEMYIIYENLRNNVQLSVSLLESPGRKLEGHYLNTKFRSAAS